MSRIMMFDAKFDRLRTCVNPRLLTVAAREACAGLRVRPRQSPALRQARSLS